jgi:signal recognition particle subunit SRP54
VAEALANDLNVVILDTAGRLHVDDTLMDEVSRIAGAAEPHEVFFVLDANTGQDAFNSATAFNEKLALSGIILTKMDSGTRGGAALSARSVIGKPIKFVGVGEKLEDLQAFHPDRLADRILGMGDVVSLVEKAQEVIDEEEAEKAAKQLFEGSFSFDDFLRTLQMVKSMGPIKDLMKMVPGMGSQMEALDNLDEREFDRNEAIILSMTLQERSHPEILNMSRRERIAHGSGVQVQKVHDMIRGFKQMKTQMKDMRKSGMLGKMFNPEKQFRRQKKSELKQLEKEGGSVLDLPAFKDLRPGAAGTRTKKQKKRKKRR